MVEIFSDYNAALKRSQGWEMDSKHEERLRRARIALEGLSVGDGFGGFFELGKSNVFKQYSENRKLPPSPWHFTDDTNMALSIYQILRRYGEIKQDELATSFAEHFDRTRGYGMGARALINRMKRGEHWRKVSEEMFHGGSYGNGGAMRVAPVGAYFADDLEAVIENAKLSAEITHAHPEGIAGAIAVAIATAIAWQSKTANQRPTRSEFIEQILPHVPSSEVRSKIQRARDIAPSTSLDHVVAMLGNGYQVTAQDTVPFVIWSAGENLDHYEQAIWQTASGLGDVDTTCAMVGGIVSMYTGIEGIPAEWTRRREPLPMWALED
jgi:ADP-ribosylglycohydrolase